MTSPLSQHVSATGPDPPIPQSQSIRLTVPQRECILLSARISWITLVEPILFRSQSGQNGVVGHAGPLARSQPFSPVEGVAAFATDLPLSTADSQGENCIRYGRNLSISLPDHPAVYKPGRLVPLESKRQLADNLSNRALITSPNIRPIVIRPLDARRTPRWRSPSSHP